MIIIPYLIFFKLRNIKFVRTSKTLEEITQGKLQYLLKNLFKDSIFLPSERNNSIKNITRLVASKLLLENKSFPPKLNLI